MEINCDLHAHSGFAGGVGKISFAKIDEMMSLKGIDIIGTGDCLHPGWLEYLKENLKESEEGIFSFEERETKFILQTEIIMTSRVETGRKSVHTIILFPSFDSIEQVSRTMKKWGVKNTIGRPFIVCKDNCDVSQKLYRLSDIDSEIEVIPAHVLTPDGIYGSNRPITFLYEFFGDFSSDVRVIETGLSADPEILSIIPELQDRTWISNSDAHSHHLHRMGREFTTYDVSRIGYQQVIEAVRRNKVVRTAEFHPAEGRYFLTGHRKSRKGHNGSYCYYSPIHVPGDHRCPICSRKLTVGVLERAVKLNIEQSSWSGDKKKRIGDIIAGLKKKERGRMERRFVNMIPLAEIVAKGLGMQSVTSKKVEKEYRKIVEMVGSECDLWFMDDATVEEMLKGIDERVYSVIIDVKQGEFGFYPPGFDGEYGTLILGKSIDVNESWEVVYGSRKNSSQSSLL